MINYNAEVPIPPSKAYTQKNSNGSEYVYYRTKYYRNSYGATTSKAILIGKKVEGKDMLIPNDNYYYHFLDGKPRAEVFQMK